jgi:PadR family transcriptional regulator PadR
VIASTFSRSSVAERVDLIIMQVLATMGPQHAYGIASRLEQVAENPLCLKQGTLYPAIVRLEQNGWIRVIWQRTENNLDAKYYSLSRAGQRDWPRKQTDGGAQRDW